MKIKFSIFKISYHILLLFFKSKRNCEMQSCDAIHMKQSGNAEQLQPNYIQSSNINLTCILAWNSMGKSNLKVVPNWEVRNFSESIEVSVILMMNLAINPARWNVNDNTFVTDIIFKSGFSFNFINLLILL